jgi:hypothetical protein
MIVTNPVLIEKPSHRGQVVAPPEEGVAHRGERDLPPARSGRREARVLPEHPGVHRPQSGPGVDTKVVGQSPAGLLVRRERLGLTSVRVESPHQQLGQPLPQRFVGACGRQRVDDPCVLTGRQPGECPVLDGAHAQLRQPRRRRGIEGSSARSATGGPRHNPTAARRCSMATRGSGGERRLAGTQPVEKRAQVVGGAVRTEEVARAGGDETLAPDDARGGALEHLAPLRDVGLHHVRGGAWCVVAPQARDEPFDGDDRPVGEQQHGEQAAALDAGQSD